MSAYNKYDSVMREQGLGTGKKYRDLTTEERASYRFAIPPPPDRRLFKPVRITIKVGDYSWHVHDQFLCDESAFIKEKLKDEPDNNVFDLSDHKPELVARMILYCYFGNYPVSPDVEVVPASKTVAQVMAENKTNPSSSRKTPTEPKFDPVLHLNMYVLATKLDMKHLQEYTLKKFKKSLATEGEGFWPCLEMLDYMDEDTAEIIESKLRHRVEGRVWKTKRSFKELEKIRPSMAAKISDFGKRRFSMP